MNLPSAEAVQELRVLVAGDVMLDRYWYGAVDRISPEAPVPVVRVQRDEERLGAAANVAVNARALGAQVSLATIVGADADGARVRALLQEQGVADHCVTDSSLRTTVKLRVIGRQQQLIRLDFEQAPTAHAQEQFTAQTVSLLGAHNLLLCSDYAKGALGGVSMLIAEARRAGCPVFIDPKGRDWARYHGASVLTPNVAELQAVVGDWATEAELENKAQSLRAQHGWDALLLTRGAQGMTLFEGQGSFHVAARAREVYDVTGAGDTVIASLAVLHAAGMPLRDAVTAANAAASVVVGKLGTAAASLADISCALL